MHPGESCLLFLPRTLCSSLGSWLVWVAGNIVPANGCHVACGRGASPLSPTHLGRYKYHASSRAAVSDVVPRVRLQRQPANTCCPGFGCHGREGRNPHDVLSESDLRSRNTPRPCVCLRSSKEHIVGLSRHKKPWPTMSFRPTTKMPGIAIIVKSSCLIILDLFFFST